MKLIELDLKKNRRLGFDNLMPYLNCKAGLNILSKINQLISLERLNNILSNYED